MPSATRLLHIDASPHRDASISRWLSSQFVDTWSSLWPNDIVTYRDLALAPPPAITAEWVAADAADPITRAPGQHRLLRFSDDAIRELRDAELLVLGTPVHNWTVPANLKAWIDHVTRAGLTFKTVGHDYRPLLSGKRAIVLRASTSDLGHPRWRGNDHHGPYIRTALAFIGIEEVEMVSVSTEARGSTERALHTIDQLTSPSPRTPHDGPGQAGKRFTP